MSDAPPSPTSKSKRRVAAGLLIVALAGGLWIERSHLAPMLNALHGSSQTAAAKPPVQAKGVPVTLTAARQGDFPLYLDGLGTVQALNTVTVRAQVTGQLIKIGFTQGHMVNKGDCSPRSIRAPMKPRLPRRAGSWRVIRPR